MPEVRGRGTEPTYRWSAGQTSVVQLILPIIVLLVVVAVVSGLVIGGVLQGHESRVGPVQAPTTEPTVLIAP